jgi:spore germination protein
MHNNKWASIFLIFLLLLMTTGCWDQREVEDIGLVLGVAIDKPKLDKEHKRILITHHFIIPKEMSGRKGGTTPKPFSNISNEGNTIFKSIRELSTRVGRPPSYEHLKVILISEQIARQIDLRQFVNFLLRNPEARRSVKVLITSGPAHKLFEYKPPIITDPAMKLLEMTQNTKKTLAIAPALNLGTMSAKLTGKTSFILQKAQSLKNEAKISGAAVVNGKTGKMVGTLNSVEVEGINWLNGKGKGGVVESLDKKKHERIVYEVRKLKSKIIPNLVNEKISFTVNIETEGALREDWNMPGYTFDEKVVKAYEQDTAMKIKQTTQKALAKMQKSCKVDAIGFGKKFNIKYPRKWKEIKDGWDERFVQIPVNINVKVQIREIGTRGGKVL